MCCDAMLFVAIFQINYEYQMSFYGAHETFTILFIHCKQRHGARAFEGGEKKVQVIRLAVDNIRLSCV